MLAGSGLIEIRKGNGAYITQLNINHVVDPFYTLLDMKCGDYSHLYLIRVRLFMEPEIAKLAATHRKHNDIFQLKHFSQQMEKFSNNTTKNVSLDIKFHRYIAGATNNPLIPVIMEPIFLLLEKFISNTYRQSNALALAIKYHHKLVDYIEAKDGDGARQAMYDHLMYAEKHVIQYYKQVGLDDFDTSKNL
jgi:GntR family transcriptional repressor for pyruvate dehydrogenase complex